MTPKLEIELLKHEDIAPLHLKVTSDNGGQSSEMSDKDIILTIVQKVIEFMKEVKHDGKVGTEQSK